MVPPYYENLGKRLIKSPKIYVADSGLACHLLGIGTEAELEKSPFLGALFEGFIASEIVKASRTVVPGMARPMERLAAAWRQRSPAHRVLEKIVVHRPPRHAAASSALAPGVKAMPWREFVNRLRD